jgi:hypothetical protein
MNCQWLTVLAMLTLHKLQLARLKRLARWPWNLIRANHRARGRWLNRFVAAGGNHQALPRRA